MKSKFLKTEDAGKNARGAAINASMENAKNKTHFSNAEKLAAEKAKLLAEMAFYGKVHLTYRKTMVTIKIIGKAIKSKSMLKEVETIFAELGYKKRETKQGVLYNILKEA